MRVTRRAVFASLSAPAVLAAQAPITVDWQRYSIQRQGERSEEHGITVQVSAASQDVRAFEVCVRWRKRFLDDGEIHESRILVARTGDKSYCSVITGGGESWVEVGVWGLRQHEYAVCAF